MQEKITRESAIRALREIIPNGSYVLFTPHGGMIVSPDANEIMRSLAFTQAMSETTITGTGKNKPNGLVRSKK